MERDQVNRAVKGEVSLSWDVDAAEAVAQVFYDAAIGLNGKVRDHGFLEDYQSLIKQIDAAREDARFFDAE